MNYMLVLTLVALTVSSETHAKAIGKHVHVLAKSNVTVTSSVLLAPGPAGKLLTFIMQRKRNVISKLQQREDIIMKYGKINETERAYQVKMFDLFRKEMNDSEALILAVMQSLRVIMKGDYRQTILNMRDNSEQRLSALKDAMLKEEAELNDIIKTELQHTKQAVNHKKVFGVLDEILADVAKAADKLEKELGSHVFEDNAKKPDQVGDVEAVFKIDDQGDVKKRALGNDSDTEDESVVKLIDAHNNLFVLQRGKDSTIPQEDLTLIMDIVAVFLVAFSCCWCCTAVGLPAMFGYIMSGVLLGPSGTNVLKSLVQLETLGEFGVLFILFSVGLDFSPDKLKKVWKVSLIGTSIMMILAVIVGIGIGTVAGISPTYSAFVAACLALSSTPLVVTFLNTKDGLPKHHRESQDSSDSDHGVILLGILVMQDVMLGLLIALLPSLVVAHNSDEDSSTTTAFAFLVARLMAVLAGVMAAGLLASRFVIGSVLAQLSASGSRELMTVGAVAICFFMLLVTHTLHISMELGCFVVGAMVGSQRHELVSDIKNLIHPIRDFFAVLFFASVGMHVFPSFVAYELTVIIWLTLAVVLIKYALSMAVLSCLLPQKTSHVRWIVSAGLSQVSEFSFVLASRARRLHLINREVYLLILSITFLSLLLAPVLWRLSLWHLRGTLTERKRSSDEKSDRCEECAT